jgi:hypothetical protein
MTEEPGLKDHTVVSCIQVAGARVTESESRTYYRDVGHPRYLPHAARCDATVREWEAWHRAHDTPEWRRYQGEQFWCVHKGGLGPPFPFCEICEEEAKSD